MPDVMAYFSHLGRSIRQAWAARAHARTAFPELAATVLREMPAHEHVAPQDVLEHVIRTPGFVNTGSSDVFGQPAVPVFIDERFHIEVLYWFDGSPGIHQHGFHGAFQVLSGSSIHAEYAFAIDESISPQFLLGTTRLLHIESLKRGDTRAIPPGAQFIHALYHLARPSTTVVVRTPMDPEFMPTLFYAAPHVAIDGFHQDRSLALRRRALAAAAQAAPERLDRLAREAMTGAGPLELYLLLSAYWGHQRDPGARRALLEAPQLVPHARLIERFVPVITRQAAVNELIQRRAFVHDERHRYLFGLLLNCPDRRSLLDLVAQHDAQRDPVELVIEWLRELRTVPSRDPAEPNALGIAIPDGELVALASILRGDDQAAAPNLRSRQIFAPLFAT